MFGGGRVEGQRRDGSKKKYAVLQDMFMYLCIDFDCYCTTIVLPFQTASSS